MVDGRAYLTARVSKQSFRADQKFTNTRRSGYSNSKSIPSTANTAG